MNYAPENGIFSILRNDAPGDFYKYLEDVNIIGDGEWALTVTDYARQYGN